MIDHSKRYLLIFESLLLVLSCVTLYATSLYIWGEDISAADDVNDKPVELHQNEAANLNGPAMHYNNYADNGVKSSIFGSMNTSPKVKLVKKTSFWFRDSTSFWFTHHQRNNSHHSDEFKRVCYYRLPESDSADELQPEDVDPFLCTHIILCVGAGATFANNTIVLDADNYDELIERMVALRQQNPSLLLLLSVMRGFDDLVENRTAVIRTAYNCRLFVQHYDLDGLDLDWEFPNWSPDPQLNQKEKFVMLVEKISTALRLVEPTYLLSIAVTGIEPMLDQCYDLPRLSSNLDFISLMAYDYHMYQWYLPFTGHNAPLYPHSSYHGFLATVNIQWSVQALLKRGVPEHKLMMGIPTYGRSWRLLSPEHQGVGAPAISGGFGEGSITYPAAVEFVASADVAAMDAEARVPYAARDKDWISYENVASAAQKAAFVRSNGLGGVMTFTLNCDDWSPLSSIRFPLHSVIKRVLGVGNNSSHDVP
uniref:Chitotriosidase-1-like n=1 Tax=Hirondellea gigas TaxID=1518452 RepID=A0A6A7GAS5_9CRUS